MLSLWAAQQDFIKRIIAIPGMRIEVENGKVIVDGRKRKEPFIALDSPSSNFGPVTVPQDKVFVMGDNRANSKDSRFFGPVPDENVEGKGFLIYWPPGRMGLLK
ncbi:MAG TPA: signal peptidase I [Actinobacteria bacterium]|nr:signal peptidase I [Actinomycetota bacterium]